MAKDLKILVVGSDRNLFVDGSAVAERIQGYAKEVNEMHIVVFSLKSHGLKEKKMGENVWLYPTNSIFKFLYPFDAARMGKQIVFQRKFTRGKSLVTAQDPFESGWAALKVKEHWRIPLEVQLHTDPFSNYFGGLLNSIRKHIARIVLTKAEKIRVVSDVLKDVIQEKYKISSNKISVLPIYIDKDRITNAKVNFDLHAQYGWNFIILCVSRLTKEKNLGQAIRVLAKLRKYHPSAGLVIVGTGPEEGELKSLAKSLNCLSNLAFVGWQQDLASYYKTADIFLQASIFEGYGMALIEAGISGLPVVTTNVGIAKDFENGTDALVCPIGDEDYMFKAVYDLIEDNGRREAMRINLRRKLETKLLSREEYLTKLVNNWQEVSTHITG